MTESPSTFHYIRKNFDEAAIVAALASLATTANFDSMSEQDALVLTSLRRGNSSLADQPIEDVQDHHEGAAANADEEAECTPEPELPDGSTDAARVREMCLKEAFDPARTLSDPVPNLRVGLFPCGGLKHGCPVAGAVEPDAQITVFGHVERIPAFELSENIGSEVV